MVDYTSRQKFADTLISKYGQNATVQKQDMNGVIITTFPCKIVILQYDDRARDGDLIRQFDIRCFMSARGISGVPTPEDKIVDSAGVVRSIVAVRPTSPDSKVMVFYELQLRE